MTLTIVNHESQVSDQPWSRVPRPAKPFLIAGALLLMLLAFNKYEELANAPLSSPWDLDQVAQTNAPYSCPGVSVADNQLSPTVKDAGTASPSLSASEGPAILQVITSAESAADTYRLNGSRNAAQCAVRLLSDSAEKNDLVSSRDIRLQRLTAGALSVILLKIRSNQDASTDAQEVANVTAWIRRLLAPTIEYYDEAGRPADQDQVWAAYDMLTFSILTSDGKLYERGSDLLNSALWSLAPTLDSRRSDAATSLHCEQILSALTPAALALEYESAAGLPGARHQSVLLHQVALECVEHEQPRQAGREARADASHQQKGAAWLSLYLAKLPTPVPSLTSQVPSGLTVWTGGKV